MTVQPAIRLTAAETALGEAYGKIMGDLPGDGAVATMRDGLSYALKTEGLPTRRREAWHYTDLKALIRTIPANDDKVVTPVAALLHGADVFSVVNGVSQSVPVVDGLTLTPYSASLQDGTAADGLEIRDAEDAIGQINGAFVADGFSLELAAGAKLESPLELQSIHSAGQYHSRFPVTFGAGSGATVIERHTSSGQVEALVSSVSDLVVGEGAEIIWIILQQQAPGDTHLGQMKVRLEKDARLTVFVINAGGRLVRQEIHVDVVGEGADFKLRGINLLGGDTHCDLTMTLGHTVVDTTSTQIIRNVVMDRAKGVFQGQIRVAAEAQKTDARMACNTLLLSDEAEFSTKPELEIFADDVQCAHGATVADIDHRQLFYLLARGIPENKARGLLVRAFVAAIVEELEDETIVEALEGVITNWLEAHD